MGAWHRCVCAHVTILLVSASVCVCVCVCVCVWGAGVGGSYRVKECERVVCLFSVCLLWFIHTCGEKEGSLCLFCSVCLLCLCVCLCVCVWPWPSIPRPLRDTLIQPALSVLR